jgi:hypothetical protein
MSVLGSEVTQKNSRWSVLTDITGDLSHRGPIPFWNTSSLLFLQVASCLEFQHLPNSPDHTLSFSNSNEFLREAFFPRNLYWNQFLPSTWPYMVFFLSNSQFPALKSTS